MKPSEEAREFFEEFRREYRNTGSMIPSSRSLARALVRPTKRGSSPRKILEIGPGTGAITDRLVRLLRPGDWLDIVEINPKFVQILERNFETRDRWRAVRAQARIYNRPLQEMPGTAEYDFLISGLPLNNFPLSLVREIFDCYERLLKPGGTLSYFEYLAIRRMKMAVVSKKERRRLHVLDRFLGRRIQRYQVAEERVFFNFPPAVARHFQFQKP